eukprot:1159762-Pelagomonas_calceolata.AAC.12
MMWASMPNHLALLVSSPQQHNITCRKIPGKIQPISLQIYSATTDQNRMQAIVNAELIRHADFLPETLLTTWTCRVLVATVHFSQTKSGKHCSFVDKVRAPSVGLSTIRCEQGACLVVACQCKQQACGNDNEKENKSENASDEGEVKKKNTTM